MPQKIFDKDLVVFQKIKPTVTLNKPAYVGICILEFNKVPKYRFHCDYIKKKYGSKSKLLYYYLQTMLA